MREELEGSAWARLPCLHGAPLCSPNPVPPEPSCPAYLPLQRAVKAQRTGAGQSSAILGADSAALLRPGLDRWAPCSLSSFTDHSLFSILSCLSSSSHFAPSHPGKPCLPFSLPMDMGTGREGEAKHRRFPRVHGSLGSLTSTLIRMASSVNSVVVT